MRRWNDLNIFITPTWYLSVTFLWACVSVCRSVGWLVGRFVCHNFLKQLKIHFDCIYHLYEPQCLSWKRLEKLLSFPLKSTLFFYNFPIIQLIQWTKGNPFLLNMAPLLATVSVRLPDFLNFLISWFWTQGYCFPFYTAPLQAGLSVRLSWKRQKKTVSH